MSASGLYGKTRIAAGIVGTAQLRLGEAVAAVLDAQIAAGGGRFRGIRLAAAWDADPAVANHRTNPPPGHARSGRLPRRLRAAGAATTSRFEVWCYHPQIPDADRAGPRLPRHDDRPRPLRRADRRRRLRGPGRRGLRGVARLRSPSSPRARTWWPSSAASTWRSTASPGTRSPGRRPARSWSTRRGLLRVHDRAVRRRPLHVRVELPGRRGELQLHGLVELVQAPHREATRRPTRPRSSTTPPRGYTGSRPSRPGRRRAACSGSARRTRG